jgi:hypothetical protein
MMLTGLNNLTALGKIRKKFEFTKKIFFSACQLPAQAMGFQPVIAKSTQI